MNSNSLATQLGRNFAVLPSGAIMIRILAVTFVLAAGLAFGTLASPSEAKAFGPHCQAYLNKPLYVAALKTVARNMQYSLEQLCSLERILAVEVQHTNLIDENQRPIPHTWVTLHYNEYSCQYFVRDADKVVTKKNCYNTF